MASLLSRLGEPFAVIAGSTRDEWRSAVAGLAPLLSEYLAQGYVSGFAESIRGYMQWLESL